MIICDTCSKNTRSAQRTSTVCDSCNKRMTVSIKTKAEERLIKAALAYDEDTTYSIAGSGPYHSAANAVRKERKKK